MRQRHLLFGCCAMIAAACLLYLLRGDDGAAPPTDPTRAAAAGRATQEAAGEVASGTETAAPARAKAQADQEGPDLNHPFSFAVRVRAVDEWGLPARGRRMRLAPVGCTRNILEEETDVDGAARMQWRARQSRMRITLAVGRGGAREFEVEAGSERELVLLAGRQSGGAAIRVRGDSNGAVVLGSGSVAGSGGSFTVEGGALQQLFASVGDNVGEVRASAGMHPQARFSDLLLPSWPPPDSGNGAAASEQASASLGIQLSGEAFSFVIQRDADASTPRFGAIVGTVFGEDGKPAANQLVVYGAEQGGPLQRTATDKDGAFRIADATLGPVFVRAGGGAAGLAQESTLVEGQGPTTLRLHLRREQRIQGRASGADGSPLAGWWVCYEALDGSWVDRTRTTADGGFILANLPPIPGRVMLCEQPDRVPSLVAQSVLPDSGALDFRLTADATPRGGIKVTLLEPTPPAQAADGAQDQPIRIVLGGQTVSLGGAAEGAAATVSMHGWHQSTGLGFRIPRADDGSFQCGGLPEGYYRIEMHDLGIGWVDLGTHHVDGKGMLDLGAVQRPATGTLAISGRPPHTTIELYRRMPWGDAQAAQEFGERTEAELPVGAWLLFQRTVDMAPKVREFEIRPGQTSTVDLGG